MGVETRLHIELFEELKPLTFSQFSKMPHEKLYLRKRELVGKKENVEVDVNGVTARLRGDWQRAKNGKKYAPIGLYNGSVNPGMNLAVSEEEWMKLPDRFKSKSGVISVPAGSMITIRGEILDQTELILDKVVFPPSE